MPVKISWKSRALSRSFTGKKLHLKLMPRHIQKSNTGKSVIRSNVNRVFSDQKSQTGLFIRKIGIVRATIN